MELGGSFAEIGENCFPLSWSLENPLVPSACIVHVSCFYVLFIMFAPNIVMFVNINIMFVSVICTSVCMCVCHFVTSPPGGDGWRWY